MLAKIKIIVWNLVRLIQKALVTLFLFLIYIFGLGVTVIFIVIFNRRLLATASGKEETFWNLARDYDADIKKSLRQS